MIAGPMHRLAARLGIRDGEAYTVVCGVLVALLLAAVGLPGVFREAARTAVAEIAAPAGSRSSPRSRTEPAPAAEPPDVAAALPALAPAGRPAGADPRPSSLDADAPGAGRGAPAPVVPPAPTRPVGDATVFAEAPDPGAPDGVAAGRDGTVYVVSGNTGPVPSVLWAFSTTGALLASWVAPAQPEARQQGLSGVAVDRDGAVWVTDAATATVLRLDAAAGTLVPVAAVDDLPACGLLELRSPCERGVVDSAPVLAGIAAAPDGTLVVADRAQGVLWTLAGTDLSVLAVLEDRLAGDGPVGVSFAGDDEVLVAVGARGSSVPPGLPALFLLRLRDGDAAGAPVLVADLAVGEVPGDVVAGGSGRVYVSIPSTATIADIGLDQGDRIDIDVRGADPSSTGPTGLALRSRSLLVTDTSDRVLDLAVDDRPVTQGPT